MWRSPVEDGVVYVRKSGNKRKIVTIAQRLFLTDIFAPMTIVAASFFEFLNTCLLLLRRLLREPIKGGGGRRARKTWYPQRVTHPVFNHVYRAIDKPFCFVCLFNCLVVFEYWVFFFFCFFWLLSYFFKHFVNNFAICDIFRCVFPNCYRAAAARYCIVLRLCAMFHSARHYKTVLLKVEKEKSLKTAQKLLATC